MRIIMIELDLRGLRYRVVVSFGATFLVDRECTVYADAAMGNRTMVLEPLGLGWPRGIMGGWDM